MAYLVVTMHKYVTKVDNHSVLRYAQRDYRVKFCELIERFAKRNEVPFDDRTQMVVLQVFI